jgi:transcriptional regulator of acetoin/glycerol metabolism
MSPPRTTATPATGGRRMDLRAIARAGERRERALAEAAAELDVIADELLEAGEFANIALAAKLAGVGRTTIYRRLVARAGPGAMVHENGRAAAA